MLTSTASPPSTQPSLTPPQHRSLLWLPKSLCPLSLTFCTGITAKRAAIIKLEDPCDVRGAQVPSLANLDTGGPERRDGGHPAPAEGEPETQASRGLSPDHGRSWHGSAEGRKQGKGVLTSHSASLTSSHRAPTCCCSEI